MLVPYMCIVALINRVRMTDRMKCTGQDEMYGFNFGLAPPQL